MQSEFNLYSFSIYNNIGNISASLIEIVLPMCNVYVNIL